MSRDPRNWQADMELCNQHKDSAVPYSITKFPKMIHYWLNEVKQLKEDNARLTCQFTGAEQKYLTQSNTIADLRNELEQMKSTAEIKYIQHTREKHEKETTLLLEHISKAEEREQKLKQLIHKIHFSEFTTSERRKFISESLSTLYPLDREDTTDGL